MLRSGSPSHVWRREHIARRTGMGPVVQRIERSKGKKHHCYNTYKKTFFVGFFIDLVSVYIDDLLAAVFFGSLDMIARGWCSVLQHAKYDRSQLKTTLKP